MFGLTSYIHTSTYRAYSEMRSRISYEIAELEKEHPGLGLDFFHVHPAPPEHLKEYKANLRAAVQKLDEIAEALTINHDRRLMAEGFDE
jgi:hypothetical protein